MFFSRVTMALEKKYSEIKIKIHVQRTVIKQKVKGDTLL